MSFWKRLGDTAEAVGKGLLNNPGSVVGAFNLAQATISGDQDEVRDNFRATLNDQAQGLADAGGTVAENTLGTSVGEKAMAALAYVPQQVSHALSASYAAGDIANAQGHIWRQFTPSVWQEAWRQTEDVSGGSVATYALTQAGAGPIVSSGKLTRDFSAYSDSTGGKLAGGAADIALTWYADPTLGLGKVAKAARAANRVEDAAEAEKVFQASKAGDKPGLVGSVFGKGADTKAQRAGRTVASIDNVQSPAEVAAKLGPTISRSSDAAPLTDLLAQAGKIDDVELQRAVKTNVILAGMGSPSARAELIEQAPAVARAMQRTESAPEEFALLDLIHARAGSDLTAHGESLTQAARDLATPENEAELVAYGKTLGHIQSRFEQLDQLAETGGTEVVGRTALDVAKGWVRSHNASFTFQDAASGRTVNALYWATGQRSRGVIATDDALRGQAELADTLKRSRLYSGAETQHVVDQYLQATTQSGRARVVEQLHDDLIERVAHSKGVSVEDMHDLRSGLQSAFNAGRQYSTQALEKARAEGEGRVLLHDPVTNAPISVKTEVLDTHIRNNVLVPDVQQMSRAVDEYLGTKTPFQAVTDAASALNERVNTLNDYWRLGMLARPGLFFRTQLDTQPRVAAMLGATAYMQNALRGSKNWATKRFTHDELVTATRQAQDDMRRDGLLADGMDDAAAYDPALTAQRRLGGTDQTVKLKGGQKARTRAYRDAQEQDDLAATLRPGDSPSDAILGLQERATRKLYENADDWKTYSPDSVHWNNAYIRATDALRNSHTAQKILREADSSDVDLIASLKADPKVRAEWREVSLGNQHFDDWLSRTVHYVDWHAPTPALRQRLADGTRLTDTEVNAYFRPHRADDVFGDTENVVTRDESGKLVDTDTRPERFEVHGPAMSVLSPDKDGDNLRSMLEKFIGKMSDKPDHVLGRHPLYVGRYFQHFRELAEREVERTGSLSTEAQASIEKVAKHRAIQDVRQTLFDTTRHTGAHATLRNVVPFLGAWEDAMSSWSRLMYDDPARIGALAKVWTAPERMQLVVDQDGNPVKPGEKADQKFVVLPVPGLAQHFIGSKTFEFRKDSLNSIFQGEVPWLPGFGPKVQVPANEILARAYPELPDTRGGNNPLVKSLFPVGVPRTDGVASDLWQGLAPSYAKRLAEAFDANADGSVAVYSDSIYSQVIDARKAGKPDPSAKALNANALKATRNVGIVRALAIGVFGISGEGGNTADFYRNQYNAMREHEAEYAAQGLTLEQAFAQEFPEAASLDFRLSKNNTGINATVKVTNRSRKFAKEIGENPEYGWFYVGSDNLGGEFSQSVYNNQRSAAVSDSDPTKRRDRFTASESMEHLQSSLGWADYTQIQTALGGILAARGLTSMQQTGASDLAEFKRQWMAKARVSNPAWAKEYDSYDPNKVQTFIDQVALPATRDKKLKDRTDIKATADYLELRQAALQVLDEAGVGGLSSNAAAPVRALLEKKGRELGAQNLGFMQTWQRVLSREVEAD